MKNDVKKDKQILLKMQLSMKKYNFLFQGSELLCNYVYDHNSYKVFFLIGSEKGCFSSFSIKRVPLNFICTSLLLQYQQIKRRRYKHMFI